MKEWIVELPHPDRLPASEAESLTAEAANLLTLQVPAPAEQISELNAPATVTFRGGITIKSSLGEAPQVYLNASATTSQMASELRKLPGVRGIDIEASGWHKREMDLTITFMATEYAIGEVPTLSIVADDIVGAAPLPAHWRGLQSRHT